jgi:hypothetical protein
MLVPSVLAIPQMFIQDSLIRKHNSSRSKQAN